MLLKNHANSKSEICKCSKIFKKILKDLTRKLIKKWFLMDYLGGVLMPSCTLKQRPITNKDKIVIKSHTIIVINITKIKQF